MSHKYFFLYSGGNEPTTPEEGKKMMDAWMAWFGRVRAHIVDGGAPCAPGHRGFGKTHHSGATGYSILKADSMEAACALTHDHPHIANGGGIEVFELIDMSKPI